MPSLRKTECWRLTIKYDSWNEPREIDFQNPPSREDFLQLVEQTPWMVSYNDYLLPVIARSDWPLISSGYKGSTTELLDSVGIPCGRLKVWKHPIIVNSYQEVPLIPARIFTGIVNRLPQGKRVEARALLNKRENRILERLVNASDLSESRMRYEARLILYAAKILKTKPTKS